MGLRAGLKALFAPGAAEQKASAVGGLTAQGQGDTTWLFLGSPKWTSRAYEHLTREGFRKNVIANRSVRLVAEGAAAVPLLLHRGDARLGAHPLLDLLRRANPFQSGVELLEAVYAYLQIAGNAYLEAVETTGGLPGELYVLRPDRMKVVPGPKGWPRAYDYSVAGRSHRFPVDPASGRSAILHVKSFHPQDDYYGLSPLEAAAMGVDIHNAAANWNKALLDNAARPSGALVFEPKAGEPGHLSSEQFDRLKTQMEDHYQGAGNAGRPFLLEGGLKWQQIAFSPSDMEFIQSKHVAAREIALAFGVPPMLLGIPGDNTYANYQEANRALWRLTLLPLIDRVVAALNGWLAPRFGPDLRLEADKDAIPALAAEREAVWTRIGQAHFLTPNEKRAELGFAPVDGGDELVAPVPLGLGGLPGGPPGNFKSGRAAEAHAALPLETKDRAAALARFQEFSQELEKAKADGKTHKVWRIVKDGKTREAHRVMEGATVPIDEDFTVAGERLRLPSDVARGSPGNTFNCRCSVEFVMRDGEGGDEESKPASRLKPLPQEPVVVEEMYKDLEFDPDGPSQNLVIITNPLDSIKVQQARTEAEAATKILFPTLHRHNDAGDAFRHAYWNFRMTQEIGLEEAKKFGDAHEREDGQLTDQQLMDLFNNHQGRILAVENPEGDAGTVVLRALRAGHLQERPVATVSPLPEDLDGQDN